MKWFQQPEPRSPAIAEIMSDVLMQATDVAEIFSSVGKAVKTASSDRPDLHFYIDPKLAENYDRHLHMASEATADEWDGSRKVVAADRKAVSDFSEETVSFPSKRKYEPNYVCSVVFQKPDDEIYAVSAYMVETYLGRYAWKSNYYFRKENRNSALRCYNRVLRAVRDLKTEFMEKDLKQSEVPYHLRRSLQGESGEIEPKSNRTATYLDPNNIPPKGEVPRPVYVPPSRGIRQDLEMGDE